MFLAKKKRGGGVKKKFPAQVGERLDFPTPCPLLVSGGHSGPVAQGMGLGTGEEVGTLPRSLEVPLPYS